MGIETVLWIAGQGIALIVGGVVAYFNICGKVADNHLLISTRVVRLETTLDLMGTNLAKLLHSPSNHLKMDELLDKYLDRHYEMTLEEWENLRIKCEKVLDDTKLSDDERTRAAILGAICCHKLLIPPDKVKKPHHDKY